MTTLAEDRTEIPGVTNRGYSFGLEFDYNYEWAPEGWRVFHRFTDETVAKGLTEYEAYKECYRRNGSPSIVSPD